MNWPRILFALTVPSLAGAVVAAPFWIKKQPVIGNAIAAALILITPIFLSVAERVDVAKYEQRCVDFARYCPIDVSALFMRMATYAVIAFAEIAVLFLVSSKFEERAKRQDFDPEWR